jgi:hypothetical protein
MAETSNLPDILSKAQAASFTGVLYIWGKKDSTTRSANIRMSEGQIHAIGYGSLAGVEAVKALLELNIDRVKIHKTSSVGLNGRQDGIPDLTRLLQMLGGSGSVNEAEVGLSVAMLQTEVLKIMAAALGDKVEAKVLAISNKHDLKNNPLDFIDECKGLVSGMFGKGRTEKMFSPIYKKLS